MDPGTCQHSLEAMSGVGITIYMTDRGHAIRRHDRPKRKRSGAPWPGRQATTSAITRQSALGRRESAARGWGSRRIPSPPSSRPVPWPGRPKKLPAQILPGRIAHLHFTSTPSCSRSARAIDNMTRSWEDSR